MEGARALDNPVDCERVQGTQRTGVRGSARMSRWAAHSRPLTWERPRRATRDCEGERLRAGWSSPACRRGGRAAPGSYTHLTLPTICSV
eukprot:7378586-Prymnesium_polylepis.1